MSTPMGVVAITLSAAAGLAAGYSIAHWRLSSIYADKADAEVEDMRKYYEDRYNPQPEEGDESVEEETARQVMADSPLPEAVVDPESRVDYHRVVETHYRVPFQTIPIDDDEDDEEDAGLGLPQHEEGDPLYEIVTSEVLGMNEYGYEETIFLTYHYHEDLLVDFWGQQVDPKQYIGLTPMPKPGEDEDVIELCVVNHKEQTLVNITIDVTPIPDSVYGKNEEYIKRRWVELQEARTRLQLREEGES